MALPLAGIGAVAQGVGALAQGLGGLAGGEEQPARDQLQQSWRSLMPEGFMESLLAHIQQLLGNKASTMAGEALPQQFDMTNIANLISGGGELDAATKKRLDELAYGSLNQAGQQAMTAVSDRAAAQGMGGSSWQGSLYGSMMQPLASQAGQLRSSLEMQQIQQQMQQGQMLAQLRQQAFANMIAAQENPALTRLTSLRLAQPYDVQKSTARGQGQVKGWGQPDWYSA
jgi:hypothetical protein